jgi:predicted nucleic acid-binding protein
MIVVDTNILVYLMVEGEKTTMAQRTFRRDSNWIVPSICRHEFLNVLATLVRHGGIEMDKAIEIWRESTQLFTVRQRDVDMLNALRLATQHKVSAYDAQYVTLASEMRVPYVTEDQRILKTFSDVAVSMQKFCEG